MSEARSMAAGLLLAVLIIRLIGGGEVAVLSLTVLLLLVPEVLDVARRNSRRVKR